MNKDKESEVKSPPPAAELAALSPSGRSPPQAAPREVHAATSDEPPPHPPRSLIADATQKKRGRKRKPALESVDPDEAKRIHNLNNKKLRDDQNELFTQLKRMVGIEAQAKKTTVLIRVVEHMQRQEEIIGSLRRKLQEFEQQTLPKVAAPSEPRPSALHEHPEGVEAAPMREAALVEQLTGAQKALHAMQASQGELKAELERFKTRMKTSERGSPTSMKHDAPRRMSEKKIPLGTPAILPKLRPGDEVPRDDVRKAAPIDPLASLTTLALAAGAAGAAPISIAPTPPPAVAPLLPSLLPTPPIPASITFPTPALPTSPSRAIVPPASPSRAVAASIAPLSASVPLVVSISAPPTVSLAPPTAPPPPLFALSPPPMPQLPPAAIGPEPEIRSTLHDWLGSADLRLSFWRHGKALRHQPGRQLPVSDKIASRLYKLPRPLFDCRNSGRDVKHEESSLSSCASPSCCRPNEDNNWMTLPCGDRIHKECYTDPAQGCFASRSVFFVPPPSVQLWRTGDTVSLVPQNASSDKPLGCIPCFAKNDAPALAIPFSMLGALKDHINTAERVLSHVEVQQGEFKGDAVVEIESDEEAKDETPAATRAHRGSSPSNSPSPASASSHSGDHLYPLMHHLTAVATSSVLHLCFKQTTSIRHRSHRRDAVEVVRVFRLRFSPPEGQALLSPWFFLAATSWSSLAERGAKMVPGEHATGQAVLDALLESGGGLD